MSFPRNFSRRLSVINSAITGRSWDDAIAWLQLAGERMTKETLAKLRQDYDNVVSGRPIISGPNKKPGRYSRYKPGGKKLQ
jgi:hypothetical protein